MGCKAENAKTKRIGRSLPTSELGWLSLARMSVLMILLIAASVSFFGSHSYTGGRIFSFYIPLIALFAVSGASAWWLKKGPRPAIFALSQLLLDTGIITWIIYLTDGPLSPFLFLYLPLIMATAMILGRTQALAMSAAASIFYSTLAWAMTSGLVSRLSGDSYTPSPSGGVFLQVIGLSSAMILVAVLTDFLLRKLHSSYAMVEESRRSLAELNNQQKTLIEGLPEGVIITGLDGKILDLNEAAQRLLWIDREEGLGKNLRDLILDIDPTCQLPASLYVAKSEEISLSIRGQNSPVVANYRTRGLFDEHGKKTGTLHLFRDVTKVRRLEEQLEMQEKMARLLAGEESAQTAVVTELPQFVGESQIMQKVFALIQKVAPSDATVLIDGESGTGKELVAKAIHLGGPRRERPFVPVNCGAIPENLIESELFGHKKGSFTGADSDHTGLFRRAEGGTIFLDEIGELPSSMQTKLLRALQEKSIRPVGSDRDVPIDVRIIAATNRNLKKEIEAGNFREDLYYRLNVIQIKLPALRERREDIPVLVNSILKGLCRSGTLPVLPPAAMQLLMNYSYPGNVRELENILERALVLGSEIILPEHFPESIRSAQSSAASGPTGSTRIIIDENLQLPVQLDDILSGIERRYLEVALLQTKGAKKKAASLLGINFRSMRYRLQKFGIGEGEEAE